jgi:cell wall-associated NlpC family hydrolase
MSILSTNRRYRLTVVLCTTVAIGTPALAGSQAPTAPSAAAPTGAPAAPTATPMPKPFEAFSNSAHSLRDSIVAVAKAQVGTRYKLGGTTPKGFDCSGLIKYIMAALNLDVPRTARQQAIVGLEIIKDTSRLLPGDVLTFGKNKQGVSHVGIYIGEGKYIHASSKAGKVIESKIDRPASPLIKIWKGARRMLTFDDDTAAAAAAVGAPGSKGGA